MKESVATGRSIIDIARDKKLLTEKEIKEILDPVSMTEPQVPKEAAKKRDEIKGEKPGPAAEEPKSKTNPSIPGNTSKQKKRKKSA